MKKIVLLGALLAAVGALAVPAARAGPDGAGSYLCWNSAMTPIAYPDAVADAMWATGAYFEPQAILGNVEGGTNIGAYHLVCNAALMMPVQNVEGATGIGDVGQVISFHDGQWWDQWGSPALAVANTMTLTEMGVGGSGEVYDAAAMAAYHVDHPVNGNDLNVYHIWK